MTEQTPPRRLGLPLHGVAVVFDRKPFIMHGFHRAEGTTATVLVDPADESTMQAVSAILRDAAAAIQALPGVATIDREHWYHRVAPVGAGGHSPFEMQTLATDPASVATDPAVAA